MLPEAVWSILTPSNVELLVFVMEFFPPLELHQDAATVGHTCRLLDKRDMVICNHSVSSSSQLPPVDLLAEMIYLILPRHTH